ncbi:hypothetical protein ACWF94_10285 [Streptomyces sp. NPDC055078]
MGDLTRLVRALRGVSESGGIVVPLGGGLFDVVITAAASGPEVAAAVDWMHPQGCGPVIATPGHPWLYWLVPPGTSGRWEPHPYAVCVGAPRTITLPPLGRRGPDGGGGSYWLRPWQRTVLVGPVMLRQALAIHRPVPSPHAAMTIPVLRTAS